MLREEMTIHKALAELKVLGSRIVSTVEDSVYCQTNKHSNLKIDGKTIADYKGYMQGCYDSSMALVDRYKAIKKAVVLSNAVTKIEVGDMEYTVAEAVWLKQHGIEYDKLLLRQMEKQYALCMKKLEEKNGDELEKKSEKYIVDMFGSSEDAKKASAAEVAREAYIAQNTYDFIDSIQIESKIQELKCKIDAFESEIDAALSCSNALTKIVVEY